MSIHRLKEILAPPANPVDPPSEKVWDSVRSTLGINLPTNLLTMSKVYGTGMIRGEEMTGLGIYNPGHPNYIRDAQNELQRLRDTRGPVKDSDMPFDVFPDENGLFPFGIDENDVWLCWQVSSHSNEWPIVIRWKYGLDGMEKFEMPLFDFLVRVFERTIELPCWPEPTFVDDMRFDSMGK